MSARARSIVEHSVSLSEAAERLAINVGSVRRLIQSGVLRGEGKTRVTTESIEKWKSHLERVLTDVMAMDGTELTEEELEVLQKSRPGRLPWQNG